MNAPSILYPEAYLNHYADRYIALGLQALGITLLQYLRDPAVCEDTAAVRRQALADCSALVRPQYQSHLQAAWLTAWRMEQELDHLPRRNDAPFQPLAGADRPRVGGGNVRRRTA